MATATDPGVSDDARGSPGESDGYRIWLYNQDGEDTPIDWDEGPLPGPGDDELLWVDVDLDSVDRLAEVWEGLGVAGIVTSLDQGDQAELAQHDDLVQLQVTTLGEGAQSEPMALHCLVGTNWIATLHRGELNLVDDFNKPFHGETYLGGLDGPAFLSMVLDWQLGAYFDAIEEVQSEIDQLDERLLAESAHDVTEEVTILQELQALRRRVRQIRRELSSQRELFERLSHPESDAVIGSKYAPDFQRLSDRLQQAIDGLDNLREMIVGSFEMFMTRTAQATNDIMKRLTIISVLLLPAAVIAGIMGMNFKVGFFETTWMFWVVIASMLLLAVITLVVAKRNRWL